MTTTATRPDSRGPGASTPQAILETVFGYPAFRGDQQQIIDHVVAGAGEERGEAGGGGVGVAGEVLALHAVAGQREGEVVVGRPGAVGQDRQALAQQLDGGGEGGGAHGLGSPVRTADWTTSSVARRGCPVIARLRQPRLRHSTVVA
ncbi:MAG: hypothetical protein ACLGIW_22010, partial [Gammaproteobacteria bacterium]